MDMISIYKFIYKINNKLLFRFQKYDFEKNTLIFPVLPILTAHFAILKCYILQ